MQELLDSDLNFNQVVHVLHFLERGQGLNEFGDRLVNSGDIELLEQVIAKMVTVNQWTGMEGLTHDLSFVADTLLHLFSPEAIREASRLLPTTPRVNEIDAEDISPENRIKFARANLQAIAVQSPSSG